MQRIRTTQMGEYVGQRITLAGWVHQIRALGKINFLIVRDGYGIAQAMTEDVSRLTPLDNLQNESVVQVEGNVVAEAQAPGGVELRDAVCPVRPEAALSPPSARGPAEAGPSRAPAADRAPSVAPAGAGA